VKNASPATITNRYVTNIARIAVRKPDAAAAIGT
jgi:hypothetical protein